MLKLLPLSLSTALMLGAVPFAEPDAPQGPAKTWEQYADPAEAGFSVAALDEIRSLADRGRSGAVVAVYKGKVFAAWGDVQRPFEARSVRKSLAGALYGQAIAEGKMKLDATLADLGIDDEPPLTPAEKAATVRDLVSARSGVFHDAAYAEADPSRPARGTHAPGTFWFYNNWDFNVLETIYERATGQDLYEAFQRRVATPIGMEDFVPSGLRVLEPSLSKFPAHTFRISARDLARFGQLYLQGGRWGNAQIVPSGWVHDSLTQHSDLGDGGGFGYLWWTYSGKAFTSDKYPGLAARDIAMVRGSGGQAMFLIPSADMVIVHRADADNGRDVPGPAIWKMVDGLVAAHTGTAVAAPRVQPMMSTPFASQAPPRPRPNIIPIDDAAMAQVIGEYLAPTGLIRVFRVDGHLFANVAGLGEAELFRTAPTAYAVMVSPGGTGMFTIGPDGKASKMTLTVGRQVIEATRK